MAADGIVVRIEDMRVRVLLERLQATMGNLTPVMDEVGSALLVRVQRTFEREEAPGGGKWRPITTGRKGQILRDSGNLYRSLNYRANNYSVTLGIGGPGQPYAAIHQFGGKTRPHVIRAKNKKALAWFGGRHPVRQVNHPGSVIPARPYLFGADGKLPAAWMGAVKDILTDYLAGNV